MVQWPDVMVTAERSKAALAAKKILLVTGGGIAAYKCLDLIRRLRERGHAVRVVMTKAAEQFVTPLSVSALTNDRVFSELFDLDDEREIGHIRLARDSDLIVVAPATADLIAKMAGGHANDLATAVLLATDKPVLVAPAMNPRMWLHPATRRNVRQLEADGIAFVGPAIGEMAERGEAGPGRLVEVPELLTAIERTLETDDATEAKPALTGQRMDGAKARFGFGLRLNKGVNGNSARGSSQSHPGSAHSVPSSSNATRPSRMPSM